MTEHGVTKDSGGWEIAPGDAVYVKGHVATREAHDPEDTVVVFEDAKGSHWSIEFHAKDINP